MNDKECCVVSHENPLDQNYWDAHYKTKTTGWDLGQISPPIKLFIDSLEDKSCAILIPGCGNSYEAEYLIEQGFTNVTVIDIAPTLVENLKTKFADNPNIKVILGDFFEHKGNYDLIIEQTFFCALPPTMRQKYVWKMHQLLSDSGKIVGLLFNKIFESGPPFGGCKAEYVSLFKDAFYLTSMEICTNSIAPRANAELFIELTKKPKSIVNLYELEGITCSGCVDSITKLISDLSGVRNVSMDTSFSELLIVSKKEIDLSQLQQVISYDQKYKINKINA